MANRLLGSFTLTIDRIWPNDHARSLRLGDRGKLNPAKGLQYPLSVSKHLSARTLAFPTPIVCDQRTPLDLRLH